MFPAAATSRITGNRELANASRVLPLIPTRRFLISVKSAGQTTFECLSEGTWGIGSGAGLLPPRPFNLKDDWRFEHVTPPNGLKHAFIALELERNEDKRFSRHVTDFWWVRWRDVAWLSRGGGSLRSYLYYFSSFGFARALEALGQAARGVVDTRNLDFGRAHPVGDDVGRFGYHEFTRPGTRPGAPSFGFSESKYSTQ